MMRLRVALAVTRALCFIAADTLAHVGTLLEDWNAWLDRTERAEVEELDFATCDESVVVIGECVCRAPIVGDGICASCEEWVARSEVQA
ncbi:hypothetical protein [Sandaracinus amylolyticus]|uniref:Secreted protein n=1 Tax=Sandaracinus amylolyticus TaxID=927083 RepID=A0A0F6YLZ8_9BACT|nr:hypothetical protein [Sandaracinus amylolyticus]AKF08863.1 hypothetical protein DB32_006012 [Sandaracinus amylolyticus]